MPKSINQLIEASILSFYEQYGSFNLCKEVNKKDHDRLENFIREQLLSLVQGVKENGVPEKRPYAILTRKSTTENLWEAKKMGHNSACDQMREYLTIK